MVVIDRGRQDGSRALFGVDFDNGFGKTDLPLAYLNAKFLSLQDR